MENNKILEIRNLAKEFGDNKILKDVNLDIEQNDIISIIGPSGTGKSTFLRCLNLLETVDSGEILYHGKSILEKTFNQRLYRSKVTMVFQQFNLFNNLTVLENCTLGQIQVLHRSKAEADKRAKDVLKDVGMAAYINARPEQISGGQKQRVAIARSLAMSPEIILFDEPTSALDPEMTGEVLSVMKNLTSQNVSMVIVSHEMDFVKDVSNKICFMNEGIIEEIASPETIFNNPKSAALKQFLGKMYK